MSTETNAELPPALPDTSSWVRRAPGDVIEAGTPYVFISTAQSMSVRTMRRDYRLDEHVPGVYWTPPPAPREPWSVLSTDRDKPTLAKVTYTVPGKVDQSQTARVYYSEGTVLDEWDYAVADLEQVVSVESLTVCPVTHVPVERALIDEAVALVNCTYGMHPHDDHRRHRDIVADLAALASDESSASDGGQS